MGVADGMLVYIEGFQRRRAGRRVNVLNQIGKVGRYADLFPWLSRLNFLIPEQIKQVVGLTS